MPAGRPVTAGVRTLRPAAPMSEEDLERYESEIELALVQEYRAVVPLFAYVVETERRFYLANTVDVTVRSDTSPACVEVELTDAWVWDMYRPARFVPVGADPDLPRRQHRAAARQGPVRAHPADPAPTGDRSRPRADRSSALGGGATGTGGGRLVRGARLRGPGAELAPRARARWTSSPADTRVGARSSFCEVKTRTSDAFGTGAEAVLPAKQRRIRRLAARWLAELTPASGRALVDLRFDVVSITGGEVDVIEDAF